MLVVRVVEHVPRKRHGSVRVVQDPDLHLTLDGKVVNLFECVESHSRNERRYSADMLVPAAGQGAPVIRAYPSFSEILAGCRIDPDLHLEFAEQSPKRVMVKTDSLLAIVVQHD